MIPVIERYEHTDLWLDGLHLMLFSHDDLYRVIEDSPYKRFTAGGGSSWVVEYPTRQDAVAAGWYDNEYTWGNAF